MEKQFDTKKLIEFAVKAPSGHNTQPWRFIVRDREIQIHPDLTRILPVVDSDNHALYIGLGCAAENIVIAAKKYGVKSLVSISTSIKNDDFIKIQFPADNPEQYDELVDFIDKRQSTRNEYRLEKISTSDLTSLQSSFLFEGVDLLTFTSSEEIKILEPFIIEGSNQQFHNKKFVSELIDWFRFSEKEANEKADGLRAACMGLPKMNRFIGKIVMKYFVSAKSEAKRWKKLIDKSAGFALFAASKNDVQHWVALGRAFQRFALTATKLNISHAHANMPCEELEVRKKLITQLKLETKHPLLIIRFGYSNKMPYSFRRNVNEVIVSNGL